MNLAELQSNVKTYILSIKLIIGANFEPMMCKICIPITWRMYTVMVH
jgi:hypothetical protein